jgi:hypothetical protein
MTEKDKELYSEIERLIIMWSNDGTKTAGYLTRKIMKTLNKNSEINMENILTKEKLLELGFKEEFVSAEESGDKPFTYFVYEVKDAFGKEKCVLISSADDENDNEFYVEFFNMPEVGIFEEYDVVKELIEVLNKAKS